jgi:hypothetical protein
MKSARFQLGPDREVALSQLHIRVVTLGFLAGSRDVIRRELLTRLPELVSRLAGPNTTFVVAGDPPSPLPNYLYLADCTSGPVRPEADFSDLVVVWFDDWLAENLNETLAAKIRAIDWTACAVDGYF